MRSRASKRQAGRSQPGRRQDFAPLDVVAGDARQVHRQPHARLGAGHPRLVALQAPDSGPLPRAGQLDFLSHRQRAVNQRAGDHGAETGYGKAAVYGQAGTAQVAPHLGIVQDAVNHPAQFVHAVAGVGRDAHHRAALKGRSRQRVLHFGLDQLHQFIVHQVGLGHHHQPSGDAQDVEDGQMLAGLGHHALIGGNNEQGQVNAAHPGQHIFDEALVARHVHDADLAAAGQRHPGKAQVNRHLPLLLLREPVGVNVGQGLDQRGLAVVNVAGGANYVHRSFS